MIQRGESGTTIVITGTLANTTQDIEASWAGLPYATIGEGVSGNFTLNLTGVTPGQGTLSVRVKNNDSLKDEVAYVGVGEVFACAGQSNMRGMGTSNQTYSHPTYKAAMLSKAGAWSELADPTGLASPYGGGADAGGSVLPLIATELMADLNMPVAFINWGVGGTGSVEWQPAAQVGWESSIYAYLWKTIDTYIQDDNFRAVLWWQGETDADRAVDQATYFVNLTNIVDGFASDMGVSTFVCKFQRCTGVNPESNQDPIIAAIGQVWVAGGNGVTGPDLTDLTSDDPYHLTTDVNLQTAATRWVTAIKTAFGW